jgi:hypothetical protein
MTRHRDEFRFHLPRPPLNAPRETTKRGPVLVTGAELTRACAYPETPRVAWHDALALAMARRGVSRVKEICPKITKENSCGRGLCKYVTRGRARS